jgi:hypothetical protein
MAFRRLQAINLTLLQVTKLRHLSKETPQYKTLNFSFLSNKVHKKLDKLFKIRITLQKYFTA